MRILAVVSILAATQANAASLYKCEGPRKAAISIQSEPCAAGSKQIWVRDGTPEPPQTAEQQRASQAKRQKDAADARSLSKVAGTYKSNNVVYYNTNNFDKAKQGCDSAKQQVQAIREREWRTLTVDRLRQLDVWVESECKPK